MPSDQSTWLLSVPQDGNSEGLLQEINTKFSSKSLPTGGIAQLQIPAFKTGTLESLITLSEELPKQDSFFTQTIAKIVDILRNLLNNDPSKLAQHILVEERPVDEYILNDWSWNEGRYVLHKSLKEIVDTLAKELTSIDNVMKSKLNNYNLAKGSLVQLQRKKTGNLSIRSLVDVVTKENFIQDSEYMETLFIAVPKNLVKDWNSKYERLASMVVPRSSSHLASDEDYTLFSVVIFRRVHDEFVNKCRENKFIVRDFVFSEEGIHTQREELETADVTEKELWTELLRLARTNFSEAFQLLVHLKVLRLFVESVLRYGLPANYIGLVIKPDPKHSKRMLGQLQAHFTYLGSRFGRGAGAKGSTGANEDFVGEYQTLLEQEMFDFVLYEVPWVTN